MTVGLLYIATGKYTIFWKDFYLTAKEFLFPGIDKKFFVFSDAPELYGENSDPNIIKIDISHREWPYNTLMRFEMFDQNQMLFKDCDFLFFYNANAVFKYTIKPEEIFPSEKEGYLVALSNNDIYDTSPDKFTYERNPDSLAYIPLGKGSKYYRGGFNGGRTPEFLELIKTCKANIEQDLQAGIIASWHDESHLNKYLLNKKIKVVGSEYGKAEEWKKPRNAKVIFLYKPDRMGSNELKNFKRTLPTYSFKRFVKKIIKKISS